MSDCMQKLASSCGGAVDAETINALRRRFEAIKHDLQCWRAVDRALDCATPIAEPSANHAATEQLQHCWQLLNDLAGLLTDLSDLDSSTMALKADVLCELLEEDETDPGLALTRSLCRDVRALHAALNHKALRKHVGQRPDVTNPSHRRNNTD